jgi:hypothetical protein
VTEGLTAGVDGISTDVRVVELAERQKTVDIGAFLGSERRRRHERDDKEDGE